MPCKQAAERKEREKYILENMKEVDLYKGVEDRVEIISMMHMSHPRDPLIKYIPYPISIEKLYGELSEHEVRRLVARIEQDASSSGVECIESIALELAAFRNANLSKLQKIMLNEHKYYPSLLFKNSDKEVVNTLLSRLESESDNRNHILLALAWAGTERVVSRFSKWVNNPPAWSKDLYISPQSYSKEAGWELDSTLTRKNLYFERCYPLVNGVTLESVGALSTCVKSEQSCCWCDRRLTNLLEIDLNNPIFGFLPIKGDRLIVATCDACSCYSDTLFMDVTLSGGVKWSKYNEKPGYLPDDSDSWEYMPDNCLSLARESRAPEYASNEFLPTSFSQIGGMPTWIQDSAYPSCPKCRNTMMFLAQISNEDIDSHSEGIYYNYICPDCNITATNYQQT